MALWKVNTKVNVRSQIYPYNLENVTNKNGGLRQEFIIGTASKQNYGIILFENQYTVTTLINEENPLKFFRILLLFSFTII